MTKRDFSLLDDPETPSLVRDVLRAGRDEQVGDYDFDAGFAKHLAVIQTGMPLPDWAKGLEGGATSGSAGAGSAATAGAGVSGALGSAVLWIAVPVVTAVVVAASMWASDSTPQAEPVVQTKAPSAVHAPVAVEAPAKTAPVEAAAKRVAEDKFELPAADEPGTAARRPAKRVDAATRARAVAATGTLPAATGASNVRSGSGDLFATARPAASERASTEPSAPEPEAPVARADEPADEAPAKLDDGRLEREMGMLAVAQRVLTTNPLRTLALTRQSESEFGTTMFTPERKQLELLALVKLGRMDEAKRLARPYLARYPNGPFSDRVRRALATGRIEH